jgi:hypothetical protein
MLIRKDDELFTRTGAGTPRASCSAASGFRPCCPQSCRIPTSSHIKFLHRAFNRPINTRLSNSAPMRLIVLQTAFGVVYRLWETHHREFLATY